MTADQTPAHPGDPDPTGDATGRLLPPAVGQVGKPFDRPDRLVEGPGVVEQVVMFGPLAVARSAHAPGWRWSTHIKPIVGTDWCQVRHVGVVLSGRLGVSLADGSSFEFGPETAYDIPPGHDGYVIGDEAAVAVEWTGVLEWLTPAQGERVLASLLFTDIVGSTERVHAIGDRRWRALLATHDEAIRQLVTASRGREVTTTGDGFLAVFEGPARAIQTAIAIRDRMRTLELELRQAVHVGEVELIGPDVRGLAVHEAARIMAAASPGEILVSSVTRDLSAASGFRFSERGRQNLRGFPNPVALFAVDAS